MRLYGRSFVLFKLTENFWLWKEMLFQKLGYVFWSNHTEFNVNGSVHRNNILIYIQQDATLHNLFYLETAQHVSGGNSTHHQERKQLYLQHLVFVTPLLLPAAIVEELEHLIINLSPLFASLQWHDVLSYTTFTQIWSRFYSLKTTKTF